MSNPQSKALARRLYALERDRIQRKQANLGYSTIDGGAIQAQDNDDNLTMVIGQQFDGTNTASVITGPTPPTPTTPLVTEYLGGLSAYWDGTFEGGAVAPMDFARVTIHAVPIADFTSPDPTDQTRIVGTLDSATGAEISFSTPLGEHVVYLVCWSQAGKFSIASTVATGTPLTSTPPTTAPGSSPSITVEGMPSSLLVKTFDDVDPSTRIQYHISTSSGFTPDIDTLSAETRATVYVVNSLPNGQPLENGVTYYVVAVAVNDVGEASPSAEVFGETDPEALLELAVARIVTGFILAGAIQVGQIMIDADEGITIPSGDGLVRFPVDGSVSSITADIITTALTMQGLSTVQDLMQILGVAELADAGVSNPTAPPSITSTWEDLPLEINSSLRGLCLDDTDDNYVLFDSSANTLRLFDVTDGSFTSAITLSTTPDSNSNVVRVGSHYFLLSFPSSPVYPYSYPMIRKYDLTGTQVATYSFSDVAGTRTTTALGTDGTNVLLSWIQDGDVKIRTYSTTGSFVTGSTYPMPSSGWSGLANTLRGSFLYGGTRTVIFTRSGQAYVFNGTTEQVSNRFASTDFLGAIWNGTEFETLFVTKTFMRWVRRHAPIATAQTVQASYTWYDGNATGGTHETEASPPASASIPAGKFTRVECSPAPSAGSGSDDPTLVRVYAGTSSRTLQQTLALGVRIAVIDTLVSGAAEPGSNTFVGLPGLTPGALQTGASDGNGPKGYIYGNGESRLGNMKVETSGEVGWLGSPITVVGASASTGWTLQSGRYVQFGPMVFLELEVTRTGADMGPLSSGGNLSPDIDVCTGIPADIRPTSEPAIGVIKRAGVQTGFCQLTSAGTVTFTDGLPSATYAGSGTTYKVRINYCLGM